MSARCVGGEQRAREQAACPAGVRDSSARDSRAERMALLNRRWYASSKTLAISS